MKAFYGEYGSFIVEMISGTAVMAAGLALWPMIRNFMDTVILNYLV